VTRSFPVRLKTCPSPLAGEVGWGVVPSLDSGRAGALRDPPTLTLPRKGGGDTFPMNGIREPNAIALREGAA
jgi:hypothetical protein